MVTITLRMSQYGTYSMYTVCSIWNVISSLMCRGILFRLLTKEWKTRCSIVLF